MSGFDLDSYEQTVGGSWHTVEGAAKGAAGGKGLPDVAGDVVRGAAGGKSGTKKRSTKRKSSGAVKRSSSSNATLPGSTTPGTGTPPADESGDESTGLDAYWPWLVLGAALLGVGCYALVHADKKGARKQTRSRPRSRRLGTRSTRRR